MEDGTMVDREWQDCGECEIPVRPGGGLGNA